MWSIFGVGVSTIAMSFWIVGNYYSYFKDYDLSTPMFMISTAFGLLGLVVGVGQMLGYA